MRIADPETTIARLRETAEGLIEARRNEARRNEVRRNEVSGDPELCLLLATCDTDGVRELMHSRGVHAWCGEGCGQ